MESCAPASADAERGSLIRRELEAAAGGGGGAVVPPGAEFDASIDDPEIEAMDEAAVAALLAKIPQARPRPLAIIDDVIGNALAMARVPLTPSKSANARGRRGTPPAPTPR
jgi:hypothetical protein